MNQAPASAQVPDSRLVRYALCGNDMHRGCQEARRATFRYRGREVVVVTNLVSLGRHVAQVAGSDGGKYPHGNPIVIRTSSAVVNLDSTISTDSSAADLVLLSHYHEDHVVGIGDAETEVRIHELDRPAVESWSTFLEFSGLEPGAWESELQKTFRWTERSDVGSLVDGTIIDVGDSTTIEVVHLPGHTPGHCGFMVEPDGVMYLADVDLSTFGPSYGDTVSCLSRMRKTLARCAELEARVYTTFHHRGPYYARAEFIAALARHAQVLDERNIRILASIGDGEKRVDELVGIGVVYRAGGKRPWYADTVEQRMCAQHLDELVSWGAVCRNPVEGTYFLA